MSAIGANGAQAATGDKTPSTTYVPISEKGAPSGVATLDAASKILPSQLPDLSTAFVPKWRATTAYAKGDKVLNPSGDIVSAKGGFTSGARYSAANWNLSGAYTKTGDYTSRPNTLGSVQGAVADYTGHVGAAGAGTDSRAAIQAMLNAASTRTDTSYYGYLTAGPPERVVLRGKYFVSAPADGSSSLKVPDWVDFDFTNAELCFQKPRVATTTWCAIQLSGQNATIRVGRLYTESGTPFPDGQDVYDGIRIWQTDGGSRVLGNAGSSIRGFQGACIRGVGCWIPYVDNILFSNSSYGYVASNYYAPADGGALGGACSAPSGFTNRSHTDLRMYGCQFVNLTKGGVVGNCQGKKGAINSGDYTKSGLTITLTNCIFENIPAKAMDITNALCLTIVGTDFEECGANGAGNGIIRIDTVRSVVIMNPRINLGGRPLAGGYIASPGAFLQNTSTQQITVIGTYLHYTVSNIMKLAVNAAASHTIGGTFKDANDFAPGPMYAGSNNVLSGAWNTNHLVLGSIHMWADATGAIRKKGSAPTSDTDGTVVAP